jgi:hypothetical protein
MPVKTVLEALDAGIAKIGSTPAAPVENEELPTGEEAGEEENPPTGDDDDTGEDGQDGEDGDAEGEDGGEGGDAGDGEDGGEGGDAEGGEDGGEGGEGGEGETPEQKAAREKAEKAAAAEPPDHVNDPIPTNLTQRTSERMQWLANEVKTLTPRAAQGDELIGYIRQSNMSADEFSMALTFGRLKHSDDVEDKRKAYQILWSGIKELAPLIGETLPGVDPLEGHPDLQARVREQKLDPKDAAELAAGRNRRKADAAAATRAGERRTSAEQQRQNMEALEKQCRADMNELGQQLAGLDTNFERKMALLQKSPKGADGMTVLQRIAMTPPQLRVNAFLKAFRAVKLPAKPPGGKPNGGKPGQQPLRANQQPAAGAGVKREAKTPIEAMNHALGLS